MSRLNIIIVSSISLLILILGLICFSTIYLHSTNEKPSPPTNRSSVTPDSGSESHNIDSQLLSIEQAVDSALAGDLAISPEFEPSPKKRIGSYSKFTSFSENMRKASLLNWAEDIAENDPATAISALEEIIDSGYSRATLDAFAFVQAVSSSLPVFHPDLIDQWLNELPDDFHEHATRYVVSTLGQIDPLYTLSVIENINKPQSARTAIRTLHQSQKEKSDPDFSYALAQHILFRGEATTFAEIVGHHLGIAAPQEASRWLDSLGDNAAYRRGWNALLNSASHNDIDTAKQLAITASKTEETGASIVSVAVSWSRVAPQAALNWVTSLENELAVKTSASQILPQWSNSAPEAAADWLDNAPLSEEAKSYLEAFTRGSASPD